MIMAHYRPQGVRILAAITLVSLLACLLHAPATRAAAPVTRHYVNATGVYGFAYPGTWATRREGRPTDVFVLAPDRQAGLRMIVLPETVTPSQALVAWLVKVIVQPVGRLISAPAFSDLNIQGEDGVGTAAYFRLQNGVAGVLLAMVVAHNSSLYVVVGADVNPHARAARRDASQLARIMASLTFLSGSIDWNALPASASSYTPGRDWTYVGVGGDAGSNGQCFYYDDPDTGSSVMVGNC
jgi:hypothetical protein